MPIDLKVLHPIKKKLPELILLQGPHIIQVAWPNNVDNPQQYSTQPQKPIHYCLR